MLQGVLVGVNDVVQKVDGFLDGDGQLIPVHRASVFVAAQHVRQVDGAQVAAFIGQQGLLAAGVGGFDFSLGGHHVVPVEPIEENDARFPVAPGGINDFVEYLFGVQLPRYLAGGGIHQIIGGIGLGRLHEFFRNADRDVEIGNIRVVRLTVDKLKDVGMVNAQNAHVGAAAGAALLDRLGGHVEHPHKADGAAGHASSGIDGAAARTQAGEGEARAAARFVNERGLLDRFKYGVHTVGHRQDKAGGQLAQRPSGVHQRGRVRKEIQRRHHLIEFLLQRLQIRFLVIRGVGGGDGPGDPVE